MTNTDTPDITAITAKDKKLIIVVTLLLLIFLSGCSLLSYSRFGTANPFASFSGLIKVTLGDSHLEQIKDEPQVIIAAPGFALERYMQERGFEPLPEEQLGALLVFSNGEEEQRIICQINRYYALWSWQE